MVGYILIDHAEYPFQQDGWMDKFKKDHASKILHGYLDSQSFLRKLQATFDMVSVPLNALPKDINRWLFGCDSIDQYEGLGRDPANYESIAWFVKEDQKSSLFYRHIRERHFQINKTARYGGRVDSPEGIYIICSKVTGGYTSNNDFMSEFLTWYRGTTEKTCFSLAYDRLYIRTMYYMMKSLADVIGNNKYVRFLTDPPLHQDFLGKNT